MLDEIQKKVSAQEGEDGEPIEFKLQMMADAKSRSIVALKLAKYKINFDGLMPFLQDVYNADIVEEQL